MVTQGHRCPDWLSQTRSAHQVQKVIVSGDFEQVGQEDRCGSVTDVEECK